MLPEMDGGLHGSPKEHNVTGQVINSALSV